MKSNFDARNKLALALVTHLFICSFVVSMSQRTSTDLDLSPGEELVDKIHLIKKGNSWLKLLFAHKINLEDFRRSREEAYFLNYII
jgi:hypothetical protein